ncbi:MAG: CoA transferase [Clostridiales Family XIII bacterium]|jgi:crotonobetainyl-CoA:carnitine CoA-transferase CaiB-like acyl-CoA transferase|nr:CoA transferase [Clostridiales Family XIII bacterium]
MDAARREAEGEGALDGVRILDFSTLLPGPFATMHLADMGADVLRVVTATRHDLLDALPPLIEGENYSAASAQLSRNKRSVLLNLREPAAVELVKRLISRYDIVVEQFRPGVMEKLGLGYETLSAVNPRLIYCSLTGYGHGNSMSLRAGHDIDYLSLGGVAGYSGRKAEGPSLNGIQIADVAAGSGNAMIAILAAVIRRARSGRGQFLDISMTDGVMAFHAMWGANCLYSGESPERESTLLNGGTLYDYYETKDGRHIAFGGLEPKFWESFCRALGREDWIPLTVNAGSEVKAEARRIFRTRDLRHWLEVFRDADACVEPVLAPGEALRSRLAREREMVVNVPAGEGRALKQVGSPYKFSETPVRFRHAGRPPSLDETKTILREFGCTESEIEDLDACGALR